MNRAAPSLAFASALAFVAAPGRAEEDGEGGARRAAIQQRKFRMDHELSFLPEFHPLDPFTKCAALGGAYTYHFTDYVAWELARGGYCSNMRTKLREQLEEDFQVPEASFEQVRAVASTALAISPAYGKYSVMNAAVVHCEFFVLVGGAGVWTTEQSNAYRLGPQLGLGFRLYLNDMVSARFDARYAFLFGGPLARLRTSQLVSLSLGLSLDFGSAD